MLFVCGLCIKIYQETAIFVNECFSRAFRIFADQFIIFNSIPQVTKWNKFIENIKCKYLNCVCLKHITLCNCLCSSASSSSHFSFFIFLFLPFFVYQSYPRLRNCKSVFLILKTAHRRTVASLSLFYRYYFGRYSSELAQLVPLSFSRVRYTLSLKARVVWKPVNWFALKTIWLVSACCGFLLSGISKWTIVYFNSFEQLPKEYSVISIYREFF